MSGAPYDPRQRRDTPLAAKIKDLIGSRGPLEISRYVEICLYDREHGYYRRQPAIGAAADFVTAPEISQVFGELVGLWSAVVWQLMGRPAPFNLVEFGPGRGTMLADALRAGARQPGFVEAARIVLVEPSETLRATQAATLHRHHSELRHLDVGEPLPDGPAIVLANEMLDAVPVGQIVRTADVDGDTRWRQRTVVLDEAGTLQFGVGAPARMRPRADAAFMNAAPLGAVFEDRDLHGLANALLTVARQAPLAALFIDYGHTESGLGDTLQAVRGHRAEHPLASPGEADLTAQVDFAAFVETLGEAARAAGQTTLAVDGPITQGEFLGRLGIVERASWLMAANPGKAAAIEAGVVRLLAVPGMGDRFKAIGLRSPGLPPLPGF